jgi:hypothetical protein
MMKNPWTCMILFNLKFLLSRGGLFVLCATLKMIIESFIRWRVLGNFFMIPHVFLVLSIGFWVQCLLCVCF